MTAVNQNYQPKSHKKLITKLCLMVVFMIGFTFALVPLYDVFCSAFGINGKTGDITFEESLTYQVDNNRELDLSFIGTVATGLSISFKPLTDELKEIKAGKFYTINYEVKNLSNNRVVARAIPSVMPSEASLYFKKLYCFCFSNQVFEPKETRIMPLRFVIETDLPKNVKDIALSYTFYKVKDERLAKL